MPERKNHPLCGWMIISGCIQGCDGKTVLPWSCRTVSPVPTDTGWLRPAGNLSPDHGNGPGGIFQQAEPGTFVPVTAGQDPGMGQDGTAEATADQGGQGVVHGGFQHDVGSKSALLEQGVDHVPAHGGGFENQGEGVILEKPQINGPKGFSCTEGNGPGGQGMGQRNPPTADLPDTDLPGSGCAGSRREVFDQDNAQVQRTPAQHLVLVHHDFFPPGKSRCEDSADGTVDRWR